ALAGFAALVWLGAYLRAPTDPVAAADSPDADGEAEERQLWTARAREIAAALGAADRGGGPARGHLYRVPGALSGGRRAPTSRGRGPGHRDQARGRAG